MGQKKIIFIILSILTLLTFFSIANVLIEKGFQSPAAKRYEARPRGVSPKKQPLKPEDTKAGKKQKLVAEDPAKYGILVQENAVLPRTQEHWDIFMKEALLDSNVLESPQADLALANAKTTQETFEEKMKLIDTRIEFFQEEERKDPHRPETQKRLEELYILKSMMAVLKDRVIVPDGQAPKAPAKVIDQQTP